MFPDNLNKIIQDLKEKTDTSLSDNTFYPIKIQDSGVLEGIIENINEIGARYESALKKIQELEKYGTGQIPSDIIENKLDNELNHLQILEIFKSRSGQAKTDSAIFDLLVETLHPILPYSVFLLGLPLKNRIRSYYRFPDRPDLAYRSENSDETLLAEKCLQTGSIILINDIDRVSNIEFKNGFITLEEKQVESVFCKPYQINDEIETIFCIFSYEKNAFQYAHVNIIVALLDYATLLLKYLNTQAELKGTQNQLVQSEKMASLGQLTAGVAHEINNPINFISAGIDTLKSNYDEIRELLENYLTLTPGSDNDDQLERLETLKEEIDVEELLPEIENLFKSIKNGATRTTEIVKNLRNFSRLDENDYKLSNLEEGIDTTLVILNSQIKDRIEIIKDYGEIPLVNCFPGQLNQVFVNILNNAAQAINGPGKIRIETRAKDGFAIIKIKDSGSGMSDEVKNRIFDPFFTTKGIGIGTGLGLSISHSIVEKHQGEILVDSKIGEGTTFTIRIPFNLS